MYQPSQHDDDVAAHNIVRSQFGAPHNGANGNHSDPRDPQQAPTYRFDPSRPRRRHTGPEAASRATEPLPDDPEPDTPGQQWTVARPAALRSADDPTLPQAVPPEGPAASAAEDAASARRMSRAERRRQAARDAHSAEARAALDATNQSTASEGSAAPRSADLDRIASFLRSTREAPDPDDIPIEPEIPATVTGLAAKTSELPTVSPRVIDAVESTPAPEAVTPAAESDVLEAIRRIPGVTDAHMSPTDQRLALDIADDVDTDIVHGKVLDVLHEQLGMQATPATDESPTFDAADSAGWPAAHGRMVLERVQVVTSGFESSVEVGLAVGHTRAVGRATGPALDWHVRRAAAEAAVDAVGVLLGSATRLVVEHVAIEPAGPVRVAVVTVLSMSGSGAEHLAGAATVSGDSSQAVANATLAALNHRVEALSTS